MSALLLLLAACGDDGPEKWEADPWPGGDSADTAPDEEAEEDVWEPGDEVPGWEDFDCGRDGGNAVSMTWPTAFSTVGVFSADAATGGPLTLDVDMGDCVAFPCGTTDEEPRLTVSFEDAAADSSLAGGTGWYTEVLSASGGQATFAATALTVFGPLFVTEEGGSGDAEASACISRVRPDQVAGVVRWSVPRVSPNTGEFDDPYDPVILRTNFAVTFPDRGGVDRAGPEMGVPGDVYWDYGVGRGYDDVWDWDAITDATLREELYLRYRPFNVE